MAEIQDFRLGDKKFTINSLSTDVWAGEIEFELSFAIDGLDEREFTFNQDDKGKVIDYNGRIYEIVSIVPEEKGGSFQKHSKYIESRFSGTN